MTPPVTHNRKYRTAKAPLAVPPTEDPGAVGSRSEGTPVRGGAKKAVYHTGKEHAAYARNVSWASLIWLGALHIGALFAPWTFTWSALAVTVFLHWVCGGLGVCLGFHRLLTHGSFSTSRTMKWVFGVLGSLAGEGTPSMWVANHRLHHARSDQEGDPHSPHDGSWWSHMFWLAYRTDGGDPEGFQQKWAPDLRRDPWLRRLDALFLPLNIGLALVLTAIGYAIGGWPMAASWLVWGVFVRMVFVLHSTWLVNSASHMWGYKNYETTDDSRNNWWVAIVTYGEGWHNNHHAHPRMAMHGHKWWEFDMTYMVIRMLKWTKLAWNVVDYRNRSEKDAAA